MAADELRLGTPSFNPVPVEQLFSPDEIRAETEHMREAVERADRSRRVREIELSSELFETQKHFREIYLKTKAFRGLLREFGIEDAYDLAEPENMVGNIHLCWYIHAHRTDALGFFSVKNTERPGDNMADSQQFFYRNR